MELAFKWLAGDTGISSAEWALRLTGWRCVYHYVGGEPVAAAIVKGTETHFVVAQQWRRKLIRRGNAQAFAGALLEDAGGMLTTRILKESVRAADFVKRLGFVHTWSDETFDFYALCHAPFQRSAPT